MSEQFHDEPIENVSNRRPGRPPKTASEALASTLKLDVGAGERPFAKPGGGTDEFSVHHIRRVLTAHPRTGDHIDGKGADALISAWKARGYILRYFYITQNPPGIQNDPNWPPDGNVAIWVMERIE